MSVTNDERREVAARLRDFEQLRELFTESNICAFEVALGVGYMDWEHICARLADLIDPEPERTCHIKLCNCTDSLGQKMYRCSECGALMTDDACFFEGELDIGGFSYCPNCGAKVVEE